MLEVIRAAAGCSTSKNLTVIVTQSKEESEAAVEMVDQISQLGLAARLVPEGAVGFEMENVDVVLVVKLLTFRNLQGLYPALSNVIGSTV